MYVINQTHEITKRSPVNDDRIYPSCIWCVKRQRRSVPTREPDWRSSVVVQHGAVEEEFGAVLISYKARQSDGWEYSRHILQNVQAEGPAGEMRIENGDEILFIDKVFIQDLSHDEVINLLRNVKVDGRTRFALVIRRCHKKKLRKTWTWITTSAILAPGSTLRPKYDDHPAVENTEYTKVENDRVEIKTTNIYKISGTELYLEIQNKRVTADVYKGTERDRTKKICKRQRYWQGEDGEVHFEAALCDEKLENYIFVGPNNEITTKNKPVWFDQTERGSDILFRRKDVYLGYSFERDQVDAQTSEFSFEEIPGDVEIDLINQNTSECLPHSTTAYSKDVLNPPFDKTSQRGSISSSNSSESSGYMSNNLNISGSLSNPSYYMYKGRETTV